MEFPTHDNDGEGQVVPPTLIQPNNRKSPYWVHYQRYDPIVHPNKVKIAVCNFCSKELSVKQGTGGLKSHLKSKHHDVYIAMGLLTAASSTAASTENDPEQPPQQQGAAAAAAASATTTTIRTPPQRRQQQRQGRAVVPSSEAEDAAITSIHNEERRKHEKHLMEMWSYTRREIHVLRQELKNHTTNEEDDEEEDNEDQRQELENDIRRLVKRKAEYAAQLGFDE